MAAPRTPTKSMLGQHQSVNIEIRVSMAARHRINSGLDLHPPSTIVHLFHGPDRVVGALAILRVLMDQVRRDDEASNHRDRSLIRFASGYGHRAIPRALRMARPIVLMPEAEQVVRKCIRLNHGDRDGRCIFG